MQIYSLLIYFRDSGQNSKYRLRKSIKVMFTAKIFGVYRIRYDTDSREKFL